MKLLLICFYVIFLFISPAYGQYKKHIVYAELLGAADVYSINAEYLFTPRQSVRLGFSWFPGDWKYYGENERTYVYIPATYQYLLGQHNHKLEILGGILGTWTLYSEHPNHLKLTPEAALAYRYQRNEGGLFLRGGCQLFAPLFISIDRHETFMYTGKHWYVWPGLAVGWSF
jgi:hypothetical protein